MKLPAHVQQEHPWVVHQITQDFVLEDLWQFPIRAQSEKGHNLAMFKEEAFEKASRNFAKRGIPRLLWNLRLWLGRVFRLDTNLRSKEEGPLPEHSLRARYKGLAIRSQLKEREVQDPPDSPFHTVYQLERELLTEIENKTVHAGMHLSWVPLKNGEFTARLAVYVKPKGLLGRFYMALIKPFRRLFIYPAWLKITGEQWQAFTSGPTAPVSK